MSCSKPFSRCDCEPTDLNNVITMSEKNKKLSDLQLTVGQRTGVDANPSVPDQQNGFLMDANTEQGSLSYPRSRLTSSISVEGAESDITLYSGPASGRTSQQDTVESKDERERRWSKSLKPAEPSPSDVFYGGNADVRLPRSTDPDVSTERPSFKPGQGSRHLTKGADD